MWLAGFGLGVSGFFMHGVALAVGSLTAVQVLQVTQLASWCRCRRGSPTSPSGVRTGWVPPSSPWVSWASSWQCVPGDDTRSGTVWSWTVVVLGSAVVVVMLLLAARRSAVPAAVLGAAAGVVFGVEGATLKVASDDIASGVSLATVLGVATWATLAAAVLGVVIQNLALRAGSLASAQASMTIATPVVSGVIGSLVFGEHLDLERAHRGRRAWPASPLPSSVSCCCPRSRALAGRERVWRAAPTSV